MKKKILRVTTIPASLEKLLKGQLEFMSEYYNVIGISGDDNGKLTEVSKQENIKVLSVEMTRKITPIEDLKALLKLYKIFKTEKPYIVHSHTPKAGTLSMLAAYFAKVPHRLHTIAGLPLVLANGKKRMLLNIVEKITYWCATKIYPNSYGLVDIILENKFTKKEKLKVIAQGSSNGIDTSHFDTNLFSIEQNNDLRQDLNIKITDTIIVFVGRLVKDKGINELIAAFKNVSQTKKNIKLLLVGIYEKDLDPVLPETENEINTNPNIIFVGWQDDVRPYLAISDILAFPSYREGFPNVVMQAASMGLSSIVTNINGCNEIITDGVNGKIIPPQNEKALKEALKLLLNDNELRMYLANNARKSITSRFERKLVWEAMLEEYRSLE